jgi:hypothetical protein
MTVEVPGVTGWKVEDQYGAHRNKVSFQGDSLWMSLDSEYEAVALRLGRNEQH